MNRSFPSLNRMYEAIGRAVCAIQIFETLIVVCAEIVRMSTQSLAGEETDWLVNPSRFKVATKLVLKQVANSASVAPDFEARVVALIDKRHRLIHRWFVENGWPGEADTAEIVRLIAFAHEVETESRFITRALAGYVLKAGAGSSDIRAQLTDIFQKVLDESDGVVDNQT